jgi:Domain of unknown function (DUF5615)
MSNATPPYRFLIDRSSARASELFPSRRVRSLEDVGLPENASDAAIVEKAWEQECIIVTANGKDFLLAIERFQKKEMQNDCHDLFGLVILPNAYEAQRRVIRGVPGKLRLGRDSISWRDVWKNNLCVRLKKVGVPDVRPLARCRYCKAEDSERPMREKV